MIYGDDGLCHSEDKHGIRHWNTRHNILTGDRIQKDGSVFKVNTIQVSDKGLYIAAKREDQYESDDQAKTAADKNIG